MPATHQWSHSTDLCSFWFKDASSFDAFTFSNSSLQPAVAHAARNATESRSIDTVIAKVSPQDVNSTTVLHQVNPTPLTCSI